MELTETILERLQAVPVIDTHEHLWDESYRLEHPGDWSALFFHYGITALRMAGMTSAEADELYAEGTPHERKWAIFARYFPLARNTGYLRSVTIALRDIYGIECIDSDSLQELSRRMAEAVRPGFHRRVLRELGGIDYCMVNCFDTNPAGERFPARTWGDLELLRQDLFADDLIYPTGYDLMASLTGVDGSTLAGWQATIDAYFARHAPACCCVKIALAYERDLAFAPGVSRSVAERLYAEHRRAPLPRGQARELEDYLFYHVLARAADYRLPVKLHTGLYSAANYLNGYALEHNVRDLAQIAVAHPECAFIAMHMAYPFQDQLVMAARQVDNLYAEMSWAWIFDPAAAARFFQQMLEAAPLNKLLGFGGDYALVENSYGHLQMARAGMAGALAGLVARRGWTLDDACEAGYYALRGAAELLMQRSSRGGL